MCGINGIYGFDNPAMAKKVLQSMNDRIDHRGPDAEGIFTDHNIALGHRRLSIIDPDPTSNQPFKSEDGNYILVFNGEIYNYREIKAKLDYPFKTNSDTEVLLAAFQKWGIKMLNLLNGMFAFAIWDKQKKELILARDRMGIKPLYIAETGKQLLFSSEFRPILHSGLVSKKLNNAGLFDYLRYQTVHTPQTIAEDIEQLPAGHYLKVSDGETKAFQYWSESGQYKNVGADYEKVKANINQLFYESVERRLVADVPVGAFLSGGIDSSAVVGAMSQISDGKINTFNVSFDNSEFSESKYARKIADKFSTEHTEIVLKPNDFLKDLPNALKAMDHPSGDGPNTYTVSKATKNQGITVALSGLGGDELFAGYDIFKRTVSLDGKRWLMSFPKFFRKMAGTAAKLTKPSVASDKIAEILIQDYLYPEYTYPFSRLVFLDRQLLQITNTMNLPQNRVFEIVKDKIGVGKSGYDFPLLSKVSFAEMNTYLQNVLLRDTDQMSMAHALEVRVPFLDHNLAEYVFSVSDQMKFPHSPKKLLIESLDELLPNEIVNRPKMGFTFPWQEWLNGELRGFASERIESLKNRKSFKAEGIESLWQSFLKGDKRVTWSRIWGLIVLEDFLMNHGIE